MRIELSLASEASAMAVSLSPASPEPAVSGAAESAFSSATVSMAALLSFAAGAMLYVVVEELIPEMSAGEHSNIGVIAFAFGFSLMMALDVALG